jgi:O-antigen/teichoic acid export membrane protein
MSSPSESDPDFRSKNISRGLGSLAIQNIVTSGLAFVFLAVLLRLTSSTDYTAYSAVLVTIGVAVIVSTFAFQFSAARYISLYLEEDEKMAWAYAKSTVILGLVFSIAATAVFELLAPTLSFYFMKNYTWTFLFELGGLWLFGYSFSTILQGVIQGMKRYSLLAKMLVASRISMVAFTILTLELYHNTSFAIIAWIIYYAILIVWPLRYTAQNLFQRFDRSYYSQVMKYSVPLAVAAILGIISSSGDPIVVGGYTDLLGPYNTAVLISTTLGLVIVTPLMTTILPEASSSSRDDAKVAYGVRLALRFLMLGLLPLSLLMASMSSQLISLFSGGGSYLSAVGALQIISLTYLFFGTQSVIYSLLQAIGKTLQVLIVGLIAATADIGLALLLVPQFGMLGGALSRTFEALAGMIVAFYFARRYLRNLDSGSFYAKSLTAAIVPSAMVFALSATLSDRTLTLVPYSLIWIAGFLACIKFLKILSDEDRVFISHLLPAALQRFLKSL